MARVELEFKPQEVSIKKRKVSARNTLIHAYARTRGMYIWKRLDGNSYVPNNLEKYKCNRVILNYILTFSASPIQECLGPGPKIKPQAARCDPSSRV